MARLKHTLSALSLDGTGYSTLETMFLTIFPMVVSASNKQQVTSSWLWKRNKGCQVFKSQKIGRYNCLSSPRVKAEVVNWSVKELWHGCQEWHCDVRPEAGRKCSGCLDRMQATSWQSCQMLEATSGTREVAERPLMGRKLSRAGTEALINTWLNVFHSSSFY